MSQTGITRGEATAGGDRAIAVRETPPWAWLNLLSLDAPLVAMLWQRLVAGEFGVELRWWHTMLLGLTAWLIYAVDRLLDARRLDLRRPHTERHAFYRQHGRLIVAGCLVVAPVVGAFAAVYCHGSEWAIASAILALVVAYAVRVHRGRDRPFCKELCVGPLFAAGATAMVWCRMITPALLVATTLFAGLVTINCLLLSHWERDLDEAQQMRRLSAASSGLVRRLPMILLFLVAVAVLLLACNLLSSPLAFPLAIGGLGLLALCVRADSLPRSLRCVLADAALLVPAAASWVWVNG